MKRITRFRIISGSLVVILLICVVALFALRHQNRSLSGQLNEQRLRSEALLSEKLLVQKGLDTTQQAYERAGREMADLSEALEHKVAVVTTQTRENRRIKKELQYARQTLDTAEVSNQELKNLIATQEKELGARSAEFSDTIQALTAQVAELEHSLQEAALSQIDQTQIIALKKNNRKTTTRARAVDKLVANATVPGVFSELDFIVEGPDGSVISDDSGEVTAKIINEEGTITASASDNLYEGLEPQTVEITFSPEDKLKPGTYTFKIFNNGKYIRSMSTELR